MELTIEKSELTIEKVGPYLPYGLKINTPYGLDVPKQGHIYTVLGISFKNKGRGDELYFEVKEKYGREMSHYWNNFKLILKPLSDLTNEIEHFVNEMGGEIDFIEDNCGVWQINEEPAGGLVTYKTFFEVFDPVEDMQEPIIMINTLSDQGRVLNGEGSRMLTYYETNYLISKHYDVFGLIPEGLAIDINTLNQ